MLISVSVCRFYVHVIDKVVSENELHTPQHTHTHTHTHTHSQAHTRTQHSFTTQMQKDTQHYLWFHSLCKIY